MNSCQHYKSGCLRNKQQKQTADFSISMVYGVYSLPFPDNLTICESTAGSRTMAIWSRVAGNMVRLAMNVTSGGSPHHLKSQENLYICETFHLQKQFASATVPTQQILYYSLLLYSLLYYSLSFLKLCNSEDSHPNFLWPVHHYFFGRKFRRMASFSQLTSSNSRFRNKNIFLTELHLGVALQGPFSSRFYRIARLRLL